MKHTIHVTVQGPDGKPVADASVLWLGARSLPSATWLCPMTIREKRRVERAGSGPEPDRRAGTGGAERRVRLRSPCMQPPLIVAAPGFGHSSRRILTESRPIREVKITLAPEVPIHGRLLTPAGTRPPESASCLNGFHNDMKTRRG